MDLILVLKNGYISEMGKYNQLIEKDGEFAAFLRQYLTNVESNILSDGTYCYFSLLYFASYFGSYLQQLMNII